MEAEGMEVDFRQVAALFGIWVSWLASLLACLKILCNIKKAIWFGIVRLSLSRYTLESRLDG